MILPLLILTVLFYNAHALERKRQEEEERQCSVSATGEEVCTSKHSDSQGDGNGSDSDGIYYDDDDYDEVEEEKEEQVDKVETKEEIDNDCVDTNANCEFWAGLGECENNPKYMLKGCPVSCNSCPKKISKGLTGEQQEEKQFLLTEIAKYGEPQDVAQSTQDKTMFAIRKSVDYMNNYIYAENPTHTLSKETIDSCRNNHIHCSYWVSLGECDNNPSFMVTKCAPACLSCHKIDYNLRCGERDPNAVPALQPGEMNLMFQRIVDTAPGNQSDEARLAAERKEVQENGTPIYTVTVHSGPETSTPPVGEDGVIFADKKRDEAESPWVVTFDNFLTDEECEHLIQQGYKNGYKRSTDVGAKQVDGSFGVHQSTGRTSENSWCDPKSGCRQDPIAHRVMQRIANVTGITSDNYEDFQLLKYQPGQFYRAHHDYISHQKNRHSGPRILTFFLYLSDVEAGGATRLNNLNIDVEPKRGRALLWPSTLSHSPIEKDYRTRHEALPVEKGTKFAANSWIHLFNNVDAQKQGCT